MDVIRLRTLAWKSVIGFGKYSDMTIHQIYSLQHTQYLRWIYFNNSKITFIDEILDKIYLWDKYRIDKPGVKPEFHDQCCKSVQGTAMYHNASLDRMKRCARAKRIMKARGIS